MHRYLDGKLNIAQVFQVFQSWRGSTNFLGWGGVAPTLDPAVRGPLAYLLGHRYRRLGQPASVVNNFFRAAEKDAPPNSLLSRLVQAELKR
jgi:hypothetical protein